MTHNTNVKRYGVVVTKQMTYKFGCDIKLTAMEIKQSLPQQGDWIIKIIFKYAVHLDHHKEFIMITRVATYITSFYSNRPTKGYETFFLFEVIAFIHS